MENPRAQAELTRRSRPVVLGAALALALGAAAPAGWAGGEKHQAKSIPFADARLIIEFNSTDEDIGVQFFLDAEGWKTIEIFSPKGQQIFEAEATGKLLRQGGGTELFLESEEPTLDELPLEKFFNRFPEGLYKFVGRTADGQRLVSTTEFTHDIPAGPDVFMPDISGEECAKNVPIPVVIAWNEVPTSIEGEPLDIVDYEVIVGDALDVHLPGTMLTVPSELLEKGTEYSFEVLAIEEGGNQTITEGCFVTAQ